MKQCSCGCGELIPRTNKHGDPATYKNGHYWKGKHHSAETRERISEAGRAEKNPNWNGGRMISSHGYIKVLVKRGNKYVYVYEHDLVIETYLGRRLTKEERVHHINKNRQDNRIENLQLLTNSEHAILHNRERYLSSSRSVESNSLT